MLSTLFSLSILLTGCASDSGEERDVTGPSQPAGERKLRAALQLDPPLGLKRLAAGEVEQMLSAALANPAVAAAVREGDVERVLVRATAASRPPAEPTGTVAFVFKRPVRPDRDPFRIVCDIAGQTPEWRGVTARVSLASGDAEGSPLWLTGANCVGMTVPDVG